MSEILRLLVFLILAGGLLTLFGGLVVWRLDDERRIRRALRNVLGVAPDSFVQAHGKGAGFAAARGKLAVAWDAGAWCLIYGLEELMGAEVLVNGEVMGRVYRGEPRRPLDKGMGDAAEVALRLLFDDPSHPDFEIILWSDNADPKKGPPSPASAGQEANRWLARAESILRRQGAQPAKSAPSAPLPAAPMAAALMAAATPLAAAAATASIEDEETESEDEEAPF